MDTPSSTSTPPTPSAMAEADTKTLDAWVKKIAYIA